MITLCKHWGRAPMFDRPRRQQWPIPPFRTGPEAAPERSKVRPGGPHLQNLHIGDWGWFLTPLNMKKKERARFPKQLVNHTESRYFVNTRTILFGCPGWTTLHYDPGSPDRTPLGWSRYVDFLYVMASASDNVQP